MNIVQIKLTILKSKTYIPSKRLGLLFTALIIGSCANYSSFSKRPQFKTTCLGVLKSEYSEYIEDEYKIAIFSDSITNYNEFNKYIKQQINLIPEIELVNPTWEEGKKENIYLWSKYFEDPYPEFTNETNGNLHIEYLPLSNGSNTIDDYDFANKESVSSKFPFYVRMRDGKKFQRLHDKNLKQIQSIPGTISAMVIYDNYGPNLKAYIKPKKAVDSSKVFFYPKQKADFDLLGFNLTTYPINKFVFFTEQISLINGKDFNEFSAPQKIEYKVERGTGLGIIDIYEKLICPYNIHDIGIGNLTMEKWDIVLYGKGVEY